MSISFELPELEDALRADYGNLNEAAKEALLIDAYRTGRLSIGRLAEVMGRSVTGIIEWLDEHHVGPCYSIVDFIADCNASQIDHGKSA